MAKTGMDIIKSMDVDEMVSFLYKCTGGFEYCPVPEYSSTAQYGEDCPCLEIEGKFVMLGTMKCIPSETCEECLRNWLEGKK